MAIGELQTSPGASAHVASGFLQTGGERLTERSTLPASGWFTRLLLRNTPVPVLIHSLLDELSARRSLQFVEDRYMPEPFLRYLNGRGWNLGPPESFFLHDRQQVRGGLVLAGRGAGESPADLRDFAEHLRRRLTHWLRMADRGPDEARLITVDDARDFFSRRFVHYDPVGVLLWAAERSPIERLFGSRSVAPRPLRIASGKIPDDLASPKTASVVPGQAAVPATLSPNQNEYRRSISRGHSGEARSGSSPEKSSVGNEAAAASAAQPATGSTGDPTETVHRAGCLQYQVVGRTRGPVRGGRKYHIRREGERLRIALLASESERLQPDHALAFFDRLQFAGDLIRTHRDLLRAMAPQPHSGATRARATVPGRNQSLSLELDCESGAFRCVAYGITPLFFRRKNGRLYPLPDSATAAAVAGGDGEPALKTVEGVFYGGDALLLVPGVYTAGERRDLAGRFRELLSAGDSGPERLAAAMGPWLDARLRGRGLLIGRP